MPNGYRRGQRRAQNIKVAELLYDNYKIQHAENSNIPLMTKGDYLDALPIWFWDLANPTYSAGMIAQVQRHTLESLRRRWAAAHPGQSFYGTKLETGDIDQFLSIVAERVRTYDAKTAARMMNAWDAVEWIDRSQSQVHKRDVLPVLHTHLERCKEHLSALKEMLEEFKTDKVDNTTAALLQKSVERMEEYTDWVKGGMQLLGAEQFYREHLDDPISWYSLTGEGTPED